MCNTHKDRDIKNMYGFPTVVEAWITPATLQWIILMPVWKYIFVAYSWHVWTYIYIYIYIYSNHSFHRSFLFRYVQGFVAHTIIFMCKINLQYKTNVYSQALQSLAMCSTGDELGPIYWDILRHSFFLTIFRIAWVFFHNFRMRRHLYYMLH